MTAPAPPAGMAPGTLPTKRTVRELLETRNTPNKMEIGQGVILQADITVCGWVVDADFGGHSRWRYVCVVFILSSLAACMYVCTCACFFFVSAAHVSLRCNSCLLHLRAQLQTSFLSLSPFAYARY